MQETESLQDNGLPQEYLNRMRSILQDELPEYLDSLDKPLYQGLRISPIKADPDALAQKLPFLLKPSAFSDFSYYVSGKYGLHPYHITGQFFLQEPSAGSAVSALHVKADDIVLDACAAPGSKSTQIASSLKDGFLVCNEYEAKRTKALQFNLERMGVDSSAVLNLPAQKLDTIFGPCFTKVLVDAPCSGEGMIKKHDAASSQWSLQNIEACAIRQKDILESAWNTLAKDGELVYSTCTYAPEENEDVVAWVLEHLEGAELLDTGLDAGRSGLAGFGFDETKVRRIFPMDGGEGHFVARFRKTEGANREDLPFLKNEKPDPAAAQFMKEQMGSTFPYIHQIRQKDGSIDVYGMNHPFLSVKKGLVHQGVKVGTVTKKRLEPDQSFYMSKAMADHSKTKTDCTLEQMDAFMHGSQLDLSAEKGYRTLCFEGVPFGFGKSDGRRITNRLPKGMRLLPVSHVLPVEDE